MGARERLPIVLEIPAVAPWLNANDRGHWAKNDDARAAWRKAGWAAARGRRPLEQRVRIVCTFHKATGGRWDAGNLYPTAKAIVDGLVDAGLLTDDANRYVEGPDCRPGSPQPARPCVLVRIEQSREPWPPA